MNLLQIILPVLVALVAAVLIVMIIVFVCYRWKRSKPNTPKVDVDRGSEHASSVQCTADSAHLPPLPIDSVFGPDRVTGEFGKKPLGFGKLPLNVGMTVVTSWC